MFQIIWLCNKFVVPLHPNLLKQFSFDTKNTAKRPRRWCKKTQCLTKIILLKFKFSRKGTKNKLL